jgi:hypothetical protein
MKMMKDNTAMAPIMTALIIVAAIALIIWGAGVGGDAGNATTSSTDGKNTQGSVTFDLVEAGAAVTAGTVEVYMVEQGAYGTTFEAREALATDGELLENPAEEGSDAAVKKAPNGSGEVTFNNVVASEEGTYYDLYIRDTNTGVGSGKYNDQIETVYLEGGLTDDNVQTINCYKQGDATTGVEVTMAERGDMQFVNDEVAVTSYTLVSDNDTFTDKTKEFTMNLANDDSEVGSITVYVEVIDNVTNTADLEMNDLYINGELVTFEEVADVTFEDDLYDTAINKNKPSTDAEGTLYVATIPVADLPALERISDENYDTLNIKIAFDADLEAATLDKGTFKITCVSNNGQKDSEFESSAFNFHVYDTASGGFA